MIEQGFALAVGILAIVLVVVAWYGPRLAATRVVASVYRVALEAAETYGGIEWLRGPDGVAYRKMLVRRAYDVFPSPIGPIHWKLFVTQERFCEWVEQAFQAMLDLAEDISQDVEEVPE